MRVECVPNFSCSAAVAAAFLERARAHRSITVLGIESDDDHHRSVLTFVGAPKPVLAAAKGLLAMAVERIDLRQHSGVHPRFGAADVIPFIPLDGTPMGRCVELAEELGAWAGEELQLPAYLYENASRTAEHRDLAALRRALGRERKPPPDFGPAAFHPTAGAVCIGARPFLIAFNVDLDSEDLPLARRIARTIRASNGGLPGVKAKGFRLATRAAVQVSMNLCDYKKTGPLAAYRAIEALAAERGVSLRGGELIGFIPGDAVERGFAEALVLDPSTFQGQILESAIAKASPHRASKAPFLDRLASTAPAPGGGSAAAQTGALAAATALKALRFTMASQSALEHLLEALDGRPCAELEQALQELIERFLSLSEDDARAFGAVAASWKLKKKDGDRAYRARVKRGAMAAALTVCLDIISAAEDVARIAEALVKHGKPHLINDSALALTLALAAAEGARWNALANSPEQPNPGGIAERLDALRQAQEAAQACLAETYQAREEP